MFKGSFTALVTPFKDGKVDEASFERLVEWQIAEGTHGLVPVGTTGESPTLSHDEHKRVVELCIKVARKRVPVIAGAGSNSTAEAIDFTQHAKRRAPTPCCIRPAITTSRRRTASTGTSRRSATPSICRSSLYNVPVRTIVDISVPTMARCAQLKNVVGVKDATANVARISQQRLACGKDFNQLSGEDATALGFMAHGGHGCISVTSNVAPRLCSQFQNACLKGDFAAALELQDKLMPLHDALFVETNPAPVKYAAWRIGIIASPECRLPLAPLTEATMKVVDEALARVGALKAKAAE